MGLENTGKSIANLRKKAGLTQKELAAYLGISDKAVSKWERGITFPDISCLEQLSKLLDTDTDSLLAGALADNEEWTGILMPDDASDSCVKTPGIDTIVYDKPMICYLLSYFMLAGIRSIQILCSESEKKFIIDEFGSGESIGISLICHTDRNKHIINQNKNVMLVLGKKLLFGRGLTRCFKIAMTHKNRFTILSLMKKNDDDSKRLDFDLTMRVKKAGFRQHKMKNFAHYYLPFLFIPKSMAGFKIPLSIKYFGETLSYLTEKKLLYTEILDRGFLEFALDSWDSISDVSVFVRLVQNMSGMSLCNLEEIAWRRGFIPKMR